MAPTLKATSSSDLHPSHINDPMFPSILDPQMLYNLPQWLVPERYKDKQSSQNMTQTRVFSVPLPHVSENSALAVRDYLIKHNPPQKAGIKDSERKLKEIKQEEKQASLKTKEAKDKLAQALLARSEKLKEIRKAHELETTKAMDDLEFTIREQTKKEDLEIEQKIKEECKLEYEQKFKEEMVQKRKRDREEDEKEDLQALATEKGEADTEETTTTARLDTTDNNANGLRENSESGNSKSKVETLEKKHADLKDSMEKLSEKKSEMIWLLKQVIKQEALQKMKMKKLKKESK